MPKEIKTSLIDDATIRLLKKFKILKKLSLEEIQSLLGTEENNYHKRIAKLVKYQPDETVIREGDFDSWIFWVVQGEFLVIKNGMTVTAFKEPGEVFGEMGGLGEHMRSASVVAARESVCVCIDMSVMDTIADTQIYKKIITGIEDLKSERLTVTTGKLIEEKQKLFTQQKVALIEKLKLMEMEEKFNEWKKRLMEWERRLMERENHLSERENRLDQIFNKSDKTNQLSASDPMMAEDSAGDSKDSQTKDSRTMEESSGTIKQDATKPLSCEDSSQNRSSPLP